MALAAVGDAEFLSTIQSTHESAAEWTSGAALSDTPPAEDLFFVSQAEGVNRLTLGLRSVHVERLGGAAEALSSPGSDVQSMARSAPGNWRMTSSTSSVLASGGCLTVSLESAAATDSVSAGRLAASVLQGMERAVSLAPGAPLELYPLKASDSREAAGRAAWLSLNRKSDAPNGRVARYASQQASAEILKKAYASAPRAIAVQSAQEQGQGLLWALLTSACPTAAEDNTSAGATAAALLAAAQGVRGVEPWISERGLGLLASEPSFGPEAPNRLASRLARALFSITAEDRGTTIAQENWRSYYPTAPSGIWRSSC